RASAAAATLARLSRMLPLLSITSPMDTGTSSCLNSVITCGVPFSATLKLFCLRSVTRCPLRSTTVVLQITRRVSTRNTCPISSGLAAAGFFACCCAYTAAAARDTINADTIAGVLLFRWRIIAQSPKRTKWRQAARLHYCHLNMPVLPIVLLVLGRITQNILIAEFDSDLGRDVGQFVQVLHGILSAASLLRNLGEQRRSGRLFRGTAAPGSCLVDTDCVDLGVGFLYQILDFAFRIAAVVVAAVGNQKQRLARILGVLHLMQGQVHRIKQSGFTLGLCERQPVLDLFQTARKRLDEVG